MPSELRKQDVTGGGLYWQWELLLLCNFLLFSWAGLFSCVIQDMGPQKWMNRMDGWGLIHVCTPMQRVEHIDYHGDCKWSKHPKFKIHLLLIASFLILSMDLIMFGYSTLGKNKVWNNVDIMVRNFSLKIRNTRSPGGNRLHMSKILYNIIALDIYTEGDAIIHAHLVRPICMHNNEARNKMFVRVLGES